MKSTAFTATAIAIALAGAIRRIASNEQPAAIEWGLVGRIVGVALVVLLLVAIFAVAVAEERDRRR
jgi:hypothetical protein